MFVNYLSQKKISDLNDLEKGSSFILTEIFKVYFMSGHCHSFKQK